MSRPSHKPLAHATETGAAWIAEIAKMLRVDRQSAWSILGAVLKTLRDRLSVAQIAHLGNQLPLVVRGALYDRWTPARKQKKIHKETEFLALVRGRLPKSIKTDAKDATVAIFTVLSHHPTGEVRKIVRTLPPQIRALVPQEPPPAPADSPFDWE